MSKGRNILNNLELLYIAGIEFNDSEVIRVSNELTADGIPFQLQNKILSLSHSSNRIENIKLTILAELGMLPIFSN